MESSEFEIINRQAVVVIHGLGEQRPMDTLREFVDGLASWIKNGDRNRESKPRYWSRPDGTSEIYETRRITMQSHKGNPKTDFYEFYWAHHMRNTSFSHLIPWVWKLLTAKRSAIPPRLRKVQPYVQILFIIALVIVSTIFFFNEDIARFIKKHTVKFASIIAFAAVVLPVIYKIIKYKLGSLLLNFAGDAARYFNPIPSNIEERSNIRKEGIAFLKKLHDSDHIKYDRIVVVGHSLGSVIAYDMVRLLWQEMFENLSPEKMPDDEVFNRMSIEAKKVYEDDYVMSSNEIKKFQDLQHECWLKYRERGNNWLITDFITCAGAIAHADFYLMGKPSFAELAKHKEFPTCPPVIETGDSSVLHFPFPKVFFVGKDENGQPKKFPVYPLNHAAVFAVTRWTNIFFTSDYIGSEARRIFRPGIKDIKVERKGFTLIPGGHTDYWNADAEVQALEQIACAIGFKPNE